ARTRGAAAERHRGATPVVEPAARPVPAAPRPWQRPALGLAMPRLSKSAAARHLQISRTTLYKLIEQGALSATPDGRIDSAELVRVAPLVDSLKERTWTSMDSTAHPQEQQHDEQGEQVVDSVYEQLWTSVHGRAPTSTLQGLVDTLREQLQLMR